MKYPLKYLPALALILIAISTLCSEQEPHENPAAKNIRLNIIYKAIKKIPIDTEKASRTYGLDALATAMPIGTILDETWAKEASLVLYIVAQRGYDTSSDTIVPAVSFQQQPKQSQPQNKPTSRFKFPWD